MLICGIKASHDGAVAVVDDRGDDGSFLIGSIEAEKIENGKRYSSMGDPALILRGLALCGVKPEQIDRWVIDGWHGLGDTPWFKPSVPIAGTKYPVAPYTQTEGGTPPFTPYKGLLRMDGFDLPYESYRHVEGHIASAYGTSAAAFDKRPAAVLVWDGGMFPQLYTVGRHAVSYHGVLFQVRSRVYQSFGMLFRPFRNDQSLDYMLSVSGKLMAYAGIGEADPKLVSAIRAVWHELDLEEPGDSLYAKVHDKLKGLNTGCVLASFQQAIGEEIVAGLARFRGVLPDELCIAGGAGLNIKWNSAIRSSGLFSDVWVPPFPNDSGSALGAAYASVLARGGREPLQWSVYSGPDLTPSGRVEGWSRRPCTIDQLAVILEQNPVVVVSGRAEIGPRALGHRSIMASPVTAGMKTELNLIKGREGYRPVAPICLESHAAEIFDPGCPDPYMLFDHKVRPEWVDKIPAVLHLDGTARLQTVTEESLPHKIVTAFYKRTGIPVLCNTSANHSGSGFFPDVASVLRWGKVNYVWSDGFLFEAAIVQGNFESLFSKRGVKTPESAPR